MGDPMGMSGGVLGPILLLLAVTVHQSVADGDAAASAVNASHVAWAVNKVILTASSEFTPINSHGRQCANLVYMCPGPHVKTKAEIAYSKRWSTLQLYSKGVLPLHTKIFSKAVRRRTSNHWLTTTECINDLKGTPNWSTPGHASQLPMVHACKVSLKESTGSSWISLNDASKTPPNKWGVTNMGFLVSYKLTFKNMSKYSLCETL